jgi:hypothetical protein
MNIRLGCCNYQKKKKKPENTAPESVISPDEGFGWLDKERTNINGLVKL